MKKARLFRTLLASICYLLTSKGLQEHTHDDDGDDDDMLRWEIDRGANAVGDLKIFTR